MKAKICGVKDSKTLNYLVDHKYPPSFVGFICNYPKSKRYLKFKKLKRLISIKKKKLKFVAVLVKPKNKILDQIKLLKFDYFQLYDVSANRTKAIKKNIKKKLSQPLLLKIYKM